jgi:hypothetical protein
MITRQALEEEANRVIAKAKAIVELQGDFEPIVQFHHRNGEWTSCPLLPPGCEGLINDGKAKDAIFGLARALVQKTDTDAVIFATDTWHGEATAEGMKYVDTEEWKRLHDFGFEKLVQRGWIKRSEAFTVTAQNSTEVLLIRQKYQRLGSGLVQLLDAKRDWFAQDKVRGRQKMFGDLRWENLGSEVATKS